MIAAELHSIDQVLSIVNVCSKYISKGITVDALCGRYCINASSILGMESLIPNFITLNIVGSDSCNVERLINELSHIEGITVNT